MKDKLEGLLDFVSIVIVIAAWIAAFWFFA
jgi:hypothetical protein